VQCAHTSARGERADTKHLLTSFMPCVVLKMRPTTGMVHQCSTKRTFELLQDDNMLQRRTCTIGQRDASSYKHARCCNAVHAPSDNMLQRRTCTIGQHDASSYKHARCCNIVPHGTAVQHQAHLQWRTDPNAEPPEPIPEPISTVAETVSFGAFGQPRGILEDATRRRELCVH
jgi:hypothetical protein